MSIFPLLSPLFDARKEGRDRLISVISVKVGRRGKEGRSKRAGVYWGIKELEGSSGEHFHLKIRICVSLRRISNRWVIQAARFDLKSFERDDIRALNTYVPSHLHAGTREMNISFLTRDPNRKRIYFILLSLFQRGDLLFPFPLQRILAYFPQPHMHARTHTHTRSLTRTTPRFIFENSLASHKREQERERDRSYFLFG